jgi:putative transposase
MVAIHHSLLPDLPPHWSPVCVSRLHYHVSWFTRERRTVLTGERIGALEAILSTLSEDLGIRLEAVAVLPEKVHLLLSLRPSDSAGSIVRELKGRSALDLLARRPELRVSLGGNLVWNETYGISTVSPGNLDRRRARLERIQRDLAAGDGFVAECSRS